ncbi:MAG: hypothetical protein M1832_000196 [Thelocarpon impressellum]|nr:MAG: hypothetical protein M1832_000196 [Thelocarpon impressellum]
MMSQPELEYVSECGRGAPSAITKSAASTLATSHAAKKTLKEDPQKAIDDFWSKFTTKTPGQAFTILPDDLYAKRAARSAPKGVVPGHNAAASFDEAVATCKAKVENISKECRRVNSKYRDPHFDIEIDLKLQTRFCLEGLITVGDEQTPASVKRVGDVFESPQFFIDGASADGEWISTIIDDKLYLLKPDYDEFTYDRFEWDEQNRVDGEDKYRKTKQTGSEALYFAQCSDPNETWLPLLEKAYAKAHGDFKAIDGGFVGEAIEDLTGGVTTELFTTDILDKEKFWREELTQVNRDFLFGCFTGLFGGLGARKGIIEGHAYSVMKAIEVDGIKLVLLKNPWGQSEWTGPWSDGSKEWTPYWMEKLDHRFGDDGAFWISYPDLLRKFQHFDRTRLFRPEDDWVVTQQWTSLYVPWSVDYLDTKFSIELTKPGPAVIVLSQLDDRYFKGLEGQYSFQLQFRVHKEGEEDYIVRSHGGYLMRRSVSTEITLEPGRYSVLVKAIATRDSQLLPPQDVVRKTCKDKRDKLLQIGLSYDLAHAKGQPKETEEEKTKREAKEAKAKRREARAERTKVRAKAKAKEKKRKAKIAAKKAKQKAREEKKKKKAAKVRNEANLDAEGAEGGKHDAKTEKGESKESEKSTENEAASGNQSKEKPRNTKSSEDDGKTDEGCDREERGVDPYKTPVSTPTPTLDQASKDDKPKADKDKVVDETASKGEAETVQPGDDADTASDLSYSDTESDTDSSSHEDEDKSSEGALASGDSDAEFASDPWNAGCIVGLRVYSRDKNVSVEVVRPKLAGTETALDVDDSAADATKEGKEVVAAVAAGAEREDMGATGEVV